MKRKLLLLSFLLYISVIGLAQNISNFGSIPLTSSALIKQDKLLDSLFQNKPEITFKFKAKSKEQVDTLITNIVSIDAFNSNTLTGRAVASKEQFREFLNLNLPYTVIDEVIQSKALNMASTMAQMSSWNRYPYYQVYDSMMTRFQTNYPNLCKRYDLVTLTSGRKLIILKITNNVNTRAAKPQFLYSSTIHGDEVCGYVMMLHLIDYLLSNYGTNTRVTNILNNIELWILPDANPDGTYHGGNTTLTGAQRYNANSVDMNRNYPDPRVGANPDGNAYQTETQTMMNFADTMNLVSSANFHGGSDVFNFPWDSWVSSTKTSADDAWWRYVGANFADTAQVNGSTTIKENGSTNRYFKETYSSGITEGGDWYVISGGRQDYMNYFKHCREVTIEVSVVKTLDSDSLPIYWNVLKNPLLKYIEECKNGIRGTITDACTGLPIHAKVFVNSHDVDSSWVWSGSRFGNYYRPIKSGTWSVTYSATGYTSQTFSITATDGTYITKDVALVPTTPYTASVSIAASPSGTICSGTSVTFTATPSYGGSSPTYQWKNGASIIPGETNSTYTSSSLLDGDAIKCVVTSSLGAQCVSGSPATSNIITIHVIGTVPEISNINQTPSSVTSSNVVSISADIVGCNTISSVTTKWCTDGTSYNNSILMNLGTSPTYTTATSIPALPGGTTVSYEIVAIDINSNTTTSSVYSYTVTSSCVNPATVFSDDFSTNTSATYTTSGAISSSIWSVVRSGADWGARRNTSPLQLELTNDVSGTANVKGWVYAYTSLGSFGSPYNTTLSSSYGIVTWTFNLRTNRTTALAGFTSTTTYGLAYILCSTSNTPNTSGSGYAVVMGGGTNNNIALLRFNNGLQGTRTTVISFGGTPANLTDYMSVEVTYNPSTNEWQLYSRDDGTTAFADPSSGTLTSVGTGTDNTYTGTAMSYLGCYWQGATTATQTAFTDNAKVTVVNPSPTAFTVTGGGSYCNGGSGVAVGVSSSESGKNYLLKNNSIYTGVQIAGTGSAISFGNQTTVGTYTVSALNSSTGCSTDMTGSVTITINPIPDAATATASQTFCGGTIANLIATAGANGNTVAWFAAASGGSALASSTSLVNGTTYYAESQNSITGCVASTRTPVIATINPVPGAASATASQSFCGSGTIANLSATVGTNGNTIAWFAASSGGSALASSISLVNGNTYYAESQNSTSGCVSLYRTPVIVIINPIPGTATATASQTICGGTIANLIATTGTNGNTVVWFAAASGGSALASSTSLVDGTTYYAESQNSTSGCTSLSRTPVIVTINPIPSVATATASQTFCGGTIANLIATAGANGNAVAWFAASSGGFALASSTSLVDGTTYYAESQNSITGCIASTRTLVIATINPVPGAASTTASQSFCGNGTIASLIATVGTNGNTIAWFDVSSGGSALTSSTSLVDGNTYYAESQNSNTGCIASSRAPVNVTINTLPSVAAITGTASICIGSTTQLADATIGGNWSSSIPGVTTVDAGGLVTGISAGTSVITYTTPADGNGCTNSTNQTITVNVLPTIAIITGNDSVDVGSTTQLADATNGGTWSSGTPVIATVDANGLVTGIDVGTSVITYTLTDINGCTNSVTQTVIVDLSTSIRTNSESAVSIYAVDNNIYIFTPKTAIINVYDMLGNLVINQQSSQGLNKLQFNNDTGVYIVKVQTGTQIITQKVMISK